ncbi:MAG: lipopolysaccharide biosynthesis protein [Pseudolabrys sp.]|nr:lipopolysaccharide biosynthesis protein [Pseudolabrys sp.]
MAMSGTARSSLTRPLSLAGLRARVKAWLANNSDASLAQRVASNAFLIRATSAALAFVAQVMLARWMGQYEYGIYVYVWTWVLVLGNLAPLGVAYSAQRFIPQYVVSKDRDGLRGFLRILGWLCFGLGTIAGALGTLSVVAIEGAIPAHYVVPFLIGMLCVPVFALSSAQDATSRAHNWINLALVPVYIVQPIVIIVAVLVVHWTGKTISAYSALAIAVSAFWIVVAAQLVLLRLRLAKTVERGARRYEVKAWIKTSLPNFLVDGFFFLLTSVDVLLLQFFVGPDQVAVYYAASKILALVMFVYFAVSSACAHRFSQYHTAGDKERLASFAVESARWTFWPSLGLAIALLALGVPFLRLFGAGFEAGYPVMFILAAGLLARASVGPAERLLSMVGQQRYSAIIYGSALAVSILICLALAPRLGAIGAAIATAAAIGTESALLFYFVKRQLGIHIFVFGSRKPD